MGGVLTAAKAWGVLKINVCITLRSCAQRPARHRLLLPPKKPLCILMLSTFRTLSERAAINKRPAGGSSAKAHGPVRCLGLEVHQTDTYHIAAIKAHANANVDADDASVSANCIGRHRRLLLLLLL